MGMDIWIHVADKDGNFVKEDLWDGRNSNWFNKIIHEDDEYEFVHWIYNDQADFVPDEIKKNFDDSEENFGYFGFKAVKVADLLNWYDRYRPDVDAGYIRKYDKWKWENKGIAPNNIYHYYDEDMSNDWVWAEGFPKEDELIKYAIIDKIDNNQVNPNDFVIIYFDW